MDGARFANALVSLDVTPAEMTWKSGVDVLSFGATKNGCLAAEAIIFFKKELVGDIAFLMKRAGHLLSKMRFVSAQLDAYISNGVWLRNAKHANAMGKKLSDSPLHFIQDTLYDLSNITYSWNSGRLKFDSDEIPTGYNWILYTYENDQQLSRELICPGQTVPNVRRAIKVNQFLTLEKNWLPSGLWIPLE